MGTTFRIARRERGQILIATALLVPVLLGMAAIAVDIGSYADDKRSLQNAADAIALAAAHDLCTANASDCSDTTAARAAADSYAAKNNINTSDMTVTFSGLTGTGGVFTSSPTVHVALARPHTFAFAQVFGVSAKDVSVKAGAAKVSPGAIQGVLPFGVTQDTIDSTSPGDLITIHNGGGGGTTGNYGGLAIDGRGSPPLEQAIRQGATGTVCSAAMTSCAPTANQCGTNAGIVFDQCFTEPGAKTGPVSSAIQARLDATSSNCDTFAEVFTPLSAVAAPGMSAGGALVEAYQHAGGRLFSPPADLNAANPHWTPTNTVTPIGTPTNTPAPTNTAAPTTTATKTPIPTDTPLGSATPVPTNTVAPTATPPSGNTGQYALNPNCNPWTGPGACPSPDDGTTVCSRRVIIIPIIDALPNGRKAVTIEGFALLFLDNHSGADVQGRFVRADVNFGALAGVYDPGSTIHYTKLVE